MGRLLRRTGQVLTVLLLATACLVAWKFEEIKRLRAVTTLFNEGRIVHNFSHMDELFESAPMPIPAPPEPLPPGPAMTMPADWEDWLARRAVTGVVVLKHGKRVHETYRLGTQQSDQRISWSVAKSYLSGLFGILLAECHVDSLDDPVTRYVPDLAGSAYDGVTIRNVLQMTSGVAFDEDYLDFWSDINKMGRVLALGGSMDDFAAGLSDRDGPAGARWHYVSIDTHVLGMVVRGATGRSLPDLLAEKLLVPMGTYGTPYYVTDGYGVAFALGGLNVTTRDYARMGEMFRLGGALQGRQIVPRAWVEESTTPSAPSEPGKLRYGYQWWMPADARKGEFMARGVYGQYVYVDRQSQTVVAINAADRSFRDTGAFDDALAMFRKISGGTQ
ncbi:serine hydrolase domain-containing protein [Sagittula stellata]|uniref:6-aminohexanoate-dimer hydrolase, putative n=1 Tax=Sagittula stellata (strain ATCC 700073 / DSM 11524 / E-37) TaxID=388399 RepID=A3K8B3_SAGS3|nr:serine hydrolase [Sagittula stellata]EBA06592.1 6-aminohexanoate-dimer hydrolase, putative [Sagittula stellata E-37]